jgi:hypothetical protein
MFVTLKVFKLIGCPLMTAEGTVGAPTCSLCRRRAAPAGRGQPPRGHRATLAGRGESPGGRGAHPPGGSDLLA